MEIVGAVLFILAIIFFAILAFASFLTDNDVAKFVYIIMTIIAIAIFCKIFFDKTPEQKIQYHQQQIEKLQGEIK